MAKKKDRPADPVARERARVLDALEADELLMEALGPLRRTVYLAVKRSEVAAFAAHDVAFECAQHAAKF